MPRSSTLVPVLVLLLANAAWASNPGGDDELDQRIDAAQAGVRANRAWRLPGEDPSANGPSDGRDAPPVVTKHCHSCWTFKFSQYMWVPGSSGTVGIGGTQVEVDQ